MSYAIYTLSKSDNRYITNDDYIGKAQIDGNSYDRNGPAATSVA